VILPAETQVPVPMSIQPLDNLLPEEPLLMMGAGPVPIPSRVATANSIVINHLGDTMAQIVEQVKSMSRYVFQSSTARILGVAGPGSAAMEMAIVNMVEHGDTVVSVCNGFFSNRLAEMAERVGATVFRLEAKSTEAATVESVRDYITRYKPRVLTIVQGETSNTVCNHRLPEICKSTMTLEMESWEIDAVITGGQKGLSSIPGVSLVAFSERAWNAIEERKKPMQHWCLDARLADKFWYGKSYHYTAPVSGVLAIHEALRLICSETLPVRFARHTRSSTSLQAGIEAMGMSLFVDKAHRLNSVIGINIPEHLDGQKLLHMMSSVYRVEISGSFGANIVRIGQMGEQARAHNIFRALHALGASVQALGANVDVPAGVSALERSIERFNERFGLMNSSMSEKVTSNKREFR